jgi:hypothetical protein
MQIKSFYETMIGSSAFDDCRSFGMYFKRE